MKAIFAFFLFLVLISSASAIDCNMLDNKELCKQIQSSGLSQSDKDYLLSDIIADQKNFPAYDFVRDWNLQVDTSKKPIDIKDYNQEFIKNAWAKILTIMPSVKENNIIYHTSQGEMLSAFDYEVQLPTGTESGDCKTKYYLEENLAQLKVYVNNVYQGLGKVVKFATNKDANIKIEYDIKVKVGVKHYEKNRYCARRENGKCVRYESVCEYDYSEYRTDILKIIDYLSGRYYNPQTTANFQVTDKYADTIKGNLTAKDYTSLHLSFNNAELNKYDYAYSVEWTKDNIINVKADKEETIKLNNLVYDNDAVKVSNAEGCKIIAYNFFGKTIFPCNLNFKDIDLKLETDKLVYNVGETIKVKVEPSNQEFKVLYADQTFNVKGGLEIESIYPHNKVSIEHNGRVYETIFHVKNNQALYILFSLSVFVAVNYVIVALLKKYWGVLA